MNFLELIAEIGAKGFDDLVGDTGTDEVQEITVKATGGTLKVTAFGETTGTIAYNATAEAMQTALVALASVDAGDIVVTGGPGDATGTKPYVLTYGGQYAETNMAAVTTDVSALEGTKTAAVTTKTPGVGAGKARVKRFLNFGYLTEICGAEDWPFLEDTEEGVAPLKVTDLRSISEVIDSTQERKLLPMDRRTITDTYGAILTTPGTPAFYYLSTGLTVNVFPANTTDTLAVDYYKVPAELAKDTDEPLLPERWHYLLVTAAEIPAYRERNNYEAANNSRTELERGLTEMANELLGWSHDVPEESIAATDPGIDS